MKVQSLLNLLELLATSTRDAFIDTGITTNSLQKIILDNATTNDAPLHGRHRNRRLHVPHFMTNDDDEQTQTQKTPQLVECESEIGWTQVIDVKSSEPLVSHQSQYQKIELYESKHFGKILVLDDLLQLTEHDADSYNEMMAHVPLMQHTNPKRVLIIGGGDGRVLHEVLKHDCVEHVDMVDLDKDVVDICQEHFAWGHQSQLYDDPRVTLHIRDGASYVEQQSSSTYDVIIQDSSDPWEYDEQTGEKRLLPAHVLYTSSHFQNLNRILTPRGIFNLQAESFHIPSRLVDIQEMRQTALRQGGFQSAKYGSITIATYSPGQIGFLLCEKEPMIPEVCSNNEDESGNDQKGEEERKMSQIQERFDRMRSSSDKRTTYYQPKLQQSAFDLPLWVEETIYNGKNPKEQE